MICGPRRARPAVELYKEGIRLQCRCERRRQADCWVVCLSAILLFCTKIAAWIADYNDERPHSARGYLTPAAYAATFTATGDRLRNPDQLRRSPVAHPTPNGEQTAEALNVAG